MLADLDREHLPAHHATHLPSSSLPALHQNFTPFVPAVQFCHETQSDHGTPVAESAIGIRELSTALNTGSLFGWKPSVPPVTWADR